MANILLISPGETPDDFDLGPGHVLRGMSDGGDLAAIDYALVWGVAEIDFARLANLKAVFSLGAGVNHLGDLTRFPSSVQLVRLIDPWLTEEMTAYVVLNVLRFHRRDPFYQAKQRARTWDSSEMLPAASDVRVGIAGAGVLGSAAAKALVALGYDVAVWSRSARHIDGVTSYAGLDELPGFLGRTNVLVSLLPLTEATRDLWCARTFALLEDGAYVINAGRGASLVEADLLDALAGGKISGAALDVFRQEPLPKDHAFWGHPNILVTPHVASLTHPSSVSSQVNKNIIRIENGERPEGLVDPVRGY